MTSTPESAKTTEPDSTTPQPVEPTTSETEPTTPEVPAAETTEADTSGADASEADASEAETGKVAAPASFGAGSSAVGTTPVAADDAAAQSAAELDEDEDEDEDEEFDEDDEFEAIGVVPPGPSLADAFVAVVGLLAVVSLLLVAFGLPALKGAPHKVPIGVAGTPEITTQIRGLFAQGGSTSFAVRTYNDEATMRKAITDRKIYGGLSVTTSAATMLVASGASPTVAQSLNSVAANLGSSGGIQIPVDDVAPLPASDARGAGFASIGLPLVIAGILPSLLLFFRRFRYSLSTSLGIAFGFSLLSGFALGAILQFYFKAVDGNFLVTALTISLGVAAIAFPLTGLGAVAGRIGIGIGVALMILLGYPLSGISTAPEWLSGFWGTIGQALPPGAEGSLLRSVAFFDGHGALTPLIVLAAWTLGGLVLAVIGALLNPLEAFDEDDEEEPADDESVLVPA